MSEEKNIRKKVKKCPNCEIVKNLENGFYKAGKYWQKRCKICHNEKRQEYPATRKPYTPKPTGFKKLPEELQKKIIYDVHIRINFKDITEKYKTEYPLKHQTILKWNREGQIPGYEDIDLPVVFEENAP